MTWDGNEMAHESTIHMQPYATISIGPCLLAMGDIASTVVEASSRGQPWWGGERQDAQRF